MLRIENFSLTLSDSNKRMLPVLENISLDLEDGVCLGLAGESGSGKSVLAMSVMGLLPKASIAKESGKILFKEKVLTNFSEGDFRKLRGCKIAMVFQEPMTAMNPLMTLFDQIAESVLAHEHGISKAELQERVRVSLLKSGFAEPEKFFHSYPHQLSGGMRQRAMLAISLVLEPELILADEPTTALDAGLQVQILAELRKRVKNEGKSLVFISHDLGVINSVSDRLGVLYAGNLIEFGPTKEVIENPRHPYTKDLLAAMPRLVQSKSLPKPIPGNLPAPDNKPLGCVYSDRCKLSVDKCKQERPVNQFFENGRSVKCWFPLEESKKI